MSTNPGRIDVHHHFLPPDFIAELARHGRDWTGGPVIPEWSVSMARAVMERHGIAVAVGSVVPFTYWGDLRAAVRWSRHCNEFMARIVQDDQAHFGAFATVPLPDTESACKEVEHALDVLKLDGVQIWSSHGGIYPGDPRFEELFVELGRRSAVVHIHPHTAPPGSDVPKLPIPYGVAEFVFDTTRCVLNLLFSGTMDRHPSIRFIVSHAGGTVPYLAQRIELCTQLPGLREKAPKGVLHHIRRLYYDTALSASEYALAAMRQLLPGSQILFGSDYPLVPESVVAIEAEGIASSRVLDEETRRRVDRDNALALFPRFAKSA